jgi:hypothetical protein
MVLKKSKDLERKRLSLTGSPLYLWSCYLPLTHFLSDFRVS